MSYQPFILYIYKYMLSYICFSSFDHHTESVPYKWHTSASNMQDVYAVDRGTSEFIKNISHTENRILYAEAVLTFPHWIEEYLGMWIFCMLSNESPSIRNNNAAAFCLWMPTLHKVMLLLVLVHHIWDIFPLAVFTLELLQRELRVSALSMWSPLAFLYR